jgi:hypothetical protein
MYALPRSVLALLIVALISIGAEPPVPNWGGNKDHFAFSVDATFYDPADAPDHPTWDFSYYYDWNLKAERYDHDEGQHIDVCRVVGIVNEACTVLSAVDGQLYVSSETKGCCHCVAPWAPLTMLPDWLARNNATYLGRSTENDQEADGWVAYGSAANRYWASIDEEQRFVKFSDDKFGSVKQWDIRTYHADTPSATLFDKPEACDARCPASPNGCQ